MAEVPLTLLSLNLLLENDNRLFVLDFFAEWCGPCKKVAPEVGDLQEQYNNEIFVLKVDVDTCDDIAIHYKITSMPTFLFIKQNVVVDKVIGANMPAIHQKIALYK
jgi:thioredoxin 1